MTTKQTKQTKQTMQEQLARIKPVVKHVDKVEVRRKSSWREDDFAYSVEYVKPTWEVLDKPQRAQFIAWFVR